MINSIVADKPILPRPMACRKVGGQFGEMRTMTEIALAAANEAGEDFEDESNRPY
ncbi:MAG: hypothetical protein IH623_18750 [Verrucomicrobia bacterium]|nr:hypothetical protein [Verrucomicrobiota bacterium]